MFSPRVRGRRPEGATMLCFPMRGAALIESNLDPWPVQALEATLDLPTDDAAPAELPYLWHWLYFLRTARRSTIGPDGHVVNQEWVDSTLRRRRLFAAA